MHRLTDTYGLDVDSPPGSLKIWDEADPKGLYCIGADPAGGVGEEVGDASTAIVIDVRNLRQVAQLRTFESNPFDFGREVAKLGRYYGGLTGLAHIVCEANSFGQCTLEVLKVEQSYWNLFAQSGKTSAHGYLRQVGFWVTSNTKDALVQDARKVWATVTSQDYLKLFGSAVRDEVLLDELESFRATRKDSGKQVFGAAEGKHDDLVTALALAWFGRSTALFAAPTLQAPKQDFPDRDFHEREDERVTRFMEGMGISWRPEDDGETFLKVQVTWKPYSESA